MENRTKVDYEVIQQIEVLREFASGILADITRYINENNINRDDKTNMMVIIDEKVTKIWDDVYSIKTLKEAYIVRGKLQIIDETIKELTNKQQGEM